LNVVVVTTFSQLGRAFTRTRPPVVQGSDELSRLGETVITSFCRSYTEIRFSDVEPDSIPVDGTVGQFAMSEQRSAITVVATLVG
jgi:hypothetical protein